MPSVTEADEVKKEGNGAGTGFFRLDAKMDTGGAAGTSRSDSSKIGCRMLPGSDDPPEFCSAADGGLPRLCPLLLLRCSF